MVSREPLQTVSDSEDAGGEPMVTTQSFGQPLQPLQAAGDSDCDGSASDSEPLLRVLATASDDEGSDDDDH